MRGTVGSAMINGMADEANKLIHENEILRAENAALKAKLAAEEWRLIEEAPKDGTELILRVVCKNSPVYKDDSWLVYKAYWYEDYGGWITKPDGALQVCQIESEILKIKVTHYRLPPKPPEVIGMKSYSSPSVAP